jgi:hypothetical protein
MIIKAPDGIGMLLHHRLAQSISISVRATVRENPLILFQSLVDHLHALMEHQFQVFDIQFLSLLRILKNLVFLSELTFYT